MARAIVALSLVAGASCGTQQQSVPSLGRPAPSTVGTTTLPVPPEPARTVVPARVATVRSVPVLAVPMVGWTRPPPAPAGVQVRSSLASWYGSESGRRTASGESFDGSSLTAAHRTLPFGTRLAVSYEGHRVDVVVNDRGPYVGGRDLDLSRSAFLALAPLSSGVIIVDWSVVP